MQAIRCSSAAPSPENGDRQTDGTDNGSGHGSDHGQPETAHCRRCDDDVVPDAGHCPQCRSFMAVPGNVGSEAIKRNRRQAGQELMEAVRRDLIEDHGGETSLTGAERLLVEQAVRLEVLGRTLASDVVKKGPGTEGGRQSLHAWLACLDRQARALNLLGTDRRVEEVDVYEAIEAAVIEANQGDQDDDDGDDSQPNGNGATQTTDPDEIAAHARAQDPGKGDPPADGTGVMAAILHAAEVRE